MSEMSNNKQLHLPSLSVIGLRGISNISIPRLGRVTLITGKNGVGKTTLLDAVRIYAERGSPLVLRSILRSREELISALDEDGDEVAAPDIEALFYGRHPSVHSSISIGPKNEARRLTITIDPGKTQTSLMPDDFPNVDEPLIRIGFQGVSEEISTAQLSPMHRLSRRRIRVRETVFPPPIQCVSSGPSIMDNESMARFWDSVALTDYETQTVQALQLIYGDEVERVAVVGDEERRVPFQYGRRAIVKMQGQERPVPLKSLGDGAARLFGVALALSNSKDGFLVIDEAENGIHHSVQASFWKMVMRTAHENNVQVLATTHGWDCVVGFAQAAMDSRDTEGILIRVEKNGDRMRVVEYSEEELEYVAEHGIEVR